MAARARPDIPAPEGQPLPTQRWAAAVDQRRTLQAECYRGLGAASSPRPWPTPWTDELLEEVCDVDLDDLDVDSSRGFGRD